MCLATACRLYERGDLSLSKAAELAGLDMDNMKHTLFEHSLDRTAPNRSTKRKRWRARHCEPPGVRPDIPTLILDTDFKPEICAALLA